MSRGLIVRPEAEAELADAVDWYNRQLPGLGAEFLLAVDALMRQILRVPMQNMKVHGNIRRGLLRRFPYAVYYLVETKRVVIIAVFHAKRDPQQWQNRT
jgi:plasmid stabilization system protein ParE